MYCNIISNLNIPYFHQGPNIIWIDKIYFGFVSFRIRELTSVESNDYCGAGGKNKSSLIENPSMISLNGFTQSFRYRVYSIGCYIFDEKTFTWSSLNIEVMSDSSLYYTHCRSTRVGTYAGGYLENNFKSIESLRNAVENNHLTNFSKTFGVSIICLVISI